MQYYRAAYNEIQWTVSKAWFESHTKALTHPRIYVLNHIHSHLLNFYGLAVKGV